MNKLLYKYSENYYIFLCITIIKLIIGNRIHNTSKEMIHENKIENEDNSIMIFERFRGFGHDELIHILNSKEFQES